MKNIKLSNEEISILDEILDFYIHTALYFPFSKYVSYRSVYKKIKILKSKLTEGS